MGRMDVTWREYEQQRRRLNARLGVVVFSLLPLPAILLAIGLSPLRMLLVVASLGMSIGILYPIWWRTKHNPLHVVPGEARARRIAWVCRPSGFLCGLAAVLSWSVGSWGAKWVGMAFGVAAALLLCFSYFSDQRAEQTLRSAGPTNQDERQ